jgi:hypothetical protein
MIDSGAMPSKKKKASHSEQDYTVGDLVKVNMHRGRIVEAEIKAVIEKTPLAILSMGFSFREKKAGGTSQPWCYLRFFFSSFFRFSSSRYPVLSNFGMLPS